MGGETKIIILLAHVCVDHIDLVDKGMNPGKTSLKQHHFETVYCVFFPTGAERTKTSNTIDIVRPS